MVAPRSFLKKIKPFSFLSAADLDTLIAGLEEAPFSKNSFCYRKGTPQKHVYLVFSGLIGLYDGEVLTDYVSRGELFGIVPAIHGAPTAFDAKALEASVCYLIDSKRFREVYEQDTRFASFFNTFIARRFHSFSRLARGREVYEDGVLAGDLGSVVSKKPALCGVRSTVEGATRIMDKSNVGSIVVVDQSAAPVGIFTNKDLRKVLIEGDKHDPVTRYMS
jgi:CBS domain-containing protein